MGQLTRTVLLPLERIQTRILLVRGHKVLLDADLASIYGVATRALNQAVKRNHERFPADFMFRLSKNELENWRSQSVMSNSAAEMALRRLPPARIHCISWSFGAPTRTASKDNPRAYSHPADA